MIDGSNPFKRRSLAECRFIAKISFLHLGTWKPAEVPVFHGRIQITDGLHCQSGSTSIRATARNRKWLLLLVSHHHNRKSIHR